MMGNIDSDKEMLLEKGQLLSILGRHEQSIECYDKILKTDSNNLTALKNKILSLVSLGKYTDTLELLSKALSIEPNDLELLLTKAKLLQFLGRHSHALSAFDQLLEKSPGNADILFHKAKSLFLIGKISESLEVLRITVSTEPFYKQMTAKDLVFARLGTNPTFKSIID
jgi:tetratricopeptide (TPR) repeat protein